MVLHLPYKRSRTRDLTPEETFCNSQHTIFRGRIERTFGELKHMFAFLAEETPFRAHTDRHSSYLHIAVAIYNTNRWFRIHHYHTPYWS